jgi:hypothetical protein
MVNVDIFPSLKWQLVYIVMFLSDMLGHDDVFKWKKTRFHFWNIKLQVVGLNVLKKFCKFSSKEKILIFTSALFNMF